MEKNKTILVVDDNVGLVQVVKTYLEQAGYRVFAAYDGEEGLRVAKATAPDLIVLDLTMPKKGGVEFYYDILDNQQKKPLYPVLILTGRGEFKDMFQDLQVEGFVAKPFEFEDFLKTVDTIIDARTRREKTVLIAEDDPFILRRIKEEFTKAHFKAEGFVSGHAFWEELRKNPPDLAVIKYTLSDMPGTAIVSRMRTEDHLSGVAVLFYAPKGYELNVVDAKFLVDEVEFDTKDFLKTSEPDRIVDAAKRILKHE